MKLRNLLLAAALLLGADPVFGATTTPSLNIRLDHGSVWRTKVNQTAAKGFLEIHNEGSVPDVLTAWSCPDADSTVLIGKDGKALTRLVIPAHQTVMLAPGKIYLALSGLHFGIERGTILPCAFTFEQAGQVGGFLNAVKPPKL